jgi:hypothetical protein
VSENIQPTPELNATELYSLAERIVQRPEAITIEYPRGRSSEDSNTRVIAASWKKEAGGSATMIHVHATQYAPISDRYHPETHIVVGALTPHTPVMANYMGAKLTKHVDGTITGEGWRALVDERFVNRWLSSGGARIALPHIPFSPDDASNRELSEMLGAGGITVNQQATEAAAHYFRTMENAPEGTESTHLSGMRALGRRILRFFGIRG